jgi:hypothetical protein
MVHAFALLLGEAHRGYELRDVPKKADETKSIKMGLMMTTSTNVMTTFANVWTP